jgi:hypothetical protein
MGILTSEFGMERLYGVTQGTLRWKTARVFREPETPALPSDAPPRRQPGPNHQHQVADVCELHRDLRNLDPKFQAFRRARSPSLGMGGVPVDASRALAYSDGPSRLRVSDILNGSMS